MFIICNYFDISNHADDTDIIIENCEDFYSELAGYNVICKEFRIQDVIDWIVNNTGSNASRFEKQLKIDSSKALNMLKLQFKIESYTKEIVENLGGIDKYKEILLANQPTTIFSEDSAVETGDGVTDTSSTSLQDVDSFFDEAIEGNDSVTEDQPFTIETISDSYDDEVMNDEGVETSLLDDSVKNEEDISVADEPDSFSEMSDALDFLGESVTPSNTISALEAYSVKDKRDIAEPSETTETLRNTEQHKNTETPRNTCVCDCIYNSDGSFKGFTEGQILKLLNELRELDNRIALDDLNPDYVMSTEELQMAVEKLEDFSPSVFKAFFIRSAQGATTETERIRCSQLIDQFINFLQSLNKG